MVPQHNSLFDTIRHRRATPDFEAAPVPDADLKQILNAGLHAPSGYNLQPWRFVVVRDALQRKAESAPVVIVATAALKAWQNGDLEKMLAMSAEHGFSPREIEGTRKGVE